MSRKLPSIIITVWMLLFTFHLNRVFAQGATWTWMKGYNGPGGGALYGTQGVPDSANNPQGLYETANWIDLEGRYWIFGGIDNNNGETNDLWMYNPRSNNWTWMRGPGGVDNQAGVYGLQGVPSPSNMPGGRGWGTTTWTDYSGDLWLFGGMGYDASGNYGGLNDLWRYNIASNEWTFVSGSFQDNAAPVYGTMQQPSPSNTPGGVLENNAAWTDNNNDLWMFGGYVNGFQTNSTNDMWRYNILNNQWTWMKGSATLNDSGSYGIRGVESPSNLPPARGTYTRWRDSVGNFYIWGGIRAFTTPRTTLNDVWKYNRATNNWTWIAGQNFYNGLGTYGVYCNQNDSVKPISRYENRTIQKLGCAAEFITFGGFDTADHAYNDMWDFNAVTNEWKWIDGKSVSADYGHYGTLGVADTGNHPPSRGGPALWLDKGGTLWMYGGMIGSNGSFVKYNDVWKCVFNQACVANIISCYPSALRLNVGASQPRCTDSCGGSAYSAAYFGTPPYTFHWSQGGTTAAIHNLCPGTYHVTVTDSVGTTLTDAVVVTAPSAQTFMLSPDSNHLAPGYSLRICSPAGYAHYVWSNGDSSGNCIYIYAPGNYSVTITDTSGCKYSSNVLYIYMTGLQELNKENIKVYPNPAQNSFVIEFPVDGERLPYHLMVYDAIGRLVDESLLPSAHNEINSAQWARGVYLLKMSDGQSGSVVMRVLKE